MGVGSILVERGLIDQEQLEQAIEEQNRTGERLDHVMVRLGLVTSSAVLEVIGQQFALPIVDLIVFVGERRWGFGLFVVDVATGRLRSLIGGRRVGLPDWSPSRGPGR